MNFKEMKAFNRLPHTSHPDIKMHTISILSSEDTVLLDLLHHNTVLTLKKKRFLDPTPNMLDQNGVGEGCENLHISGHIRYSLHISKCENYHLAGH